MVIVPLALLALTQDFDAKKAWDTVSGRIKAMYWAKNSEPGKVERLLKEAEPAATRAQSVAEFNDAMDAMIAKFGDSHFDFLTKEDQGFYLFDGFAKADKAAKMPNIGAWFKKTADGYTVQMVLNGSAAEAAGLRKGDLVTRIDGQPFTPVASLFPKVGKSAQFEVMPKGSSGTKSVELEVSETPGHDLFLEASRKSGRIIEQGGKKIAYFHLWTMANDKFRAALESFVYGRAQDSDAFILDIRDGFGGRPEGYGDPFFRPDAKLEWTIGAGGSIKQLFGYGRPLVVIINEGSRSAKEVFSYLIKKSKRATLVGSRTAGDVLGTSPSPVGDWAYVEIPMVDVKVDGVRLEKNPVQADVQVPAEFDAAGKDLFLDKALEIAVQKASVKQTWL